MSKIIDNIENTEELSEGTGRIIRFPYSITRQRWIIVRNETDILCGLTRNYDFKPIHKIGDTAIKTYRSKKSALSSFRKCWRGAEEAVLDDDKMTFGGNTYAAIEVTEVIKNIEIQEPKEQSPRKMGTT
jgi:hypothetical protein